MKVLLDMKTVREVICVDWEQPDTDPALETTFSYIADCGHTRAIEWFKVSDGYKRVTVPTALFIWIEAQREAGATQVTL